MPLDDLTIRNAKPREKPFKLFDEKGLFLLVNPNASKLWRLKYPFAGKEKLLALGAYPEVSLKTARAKRDEARLAIRDGRDPCGERKAAKRRQVTEAQNAFRTIALEFIDKMGRRWGEGIGPMQSGDLKRMSSRRLEPVRLDKSSRLNCSKSFAGSRRVTLTKWRTGSAPYADRFSVMASPAVSAPAIPPRISRSADAGQIVAHANNSIRRAAGPIARDRRMRGSARLPGSTNAACS